MKLSRAKKTLLVGLGIFFVVLLAARAALPGFLLKKINEKIAVSSKTVYAHIEDLDFAILWSSYRIEGLTLKSKVLPEAKGFFKIEAASVSIAWRELFRGHIRADVDIQGMELVFGQELNSLKTANTTNEKATDARDLLAHIVPIDVERLTLGNSRIFYEYARDGKVYEIFSNLQGRVSHLSSAPEKKILIPSLLSLKADLFGIASTSVTGRLLPLARPVAMDLDIKVQGFEMVRANPFLLDVVPLTFTQGKMDAYSEIKLENNEVHGYIKPFLRNVDVIASHEKFKSGTHIVIEAVSALSNILLKNRGPAKSTAAQIEFSLVNEKFEMKVLKSFVTAIKHGYVEPLSEDFDHSVSVQGLEKFD